MISAIRDGHMEISKAIYVLTDRSKTEVFGTFYNFEYAHLFAYDLSFYLMSEAIEASPKVLLLIYEFKDWAWRFRKIATYKNGKMIACDHRRKEFLNVKI